jgi:hypothetical protein
VINYTFTLYAFGIIYFNILYNLPSQHMKSLNLTKSDVRSMCVVILYRGSNVFLRFIMLTLSIRRKFRCFSCHLPRLGVCDAVFHLYVHSTVVLPLIHITFRKNEMYLYTF